MTNAGFGGMDGNQINETRGSLDSRDIEENETSEEYCEKGASEVVARSNKGFRHARTTGF